MFADLDVIFIEIRVDDPRVDLRHGDRCCKNLFVCIVNSIYDDVSV